MGLGLSRTKSQATTVSYARNIANRPIRTPPAWYEQVPQELDFPTSPYYRLVYAFRAAAI